MMWEDSEGQCWRSILESHQSGPLQQMQMGTLFMLELELGTWHALTCEQVTFD